MKHYAILMIGFALAATPCWSEVFVLRDGNQVEGSISRTSPDGRVTIKMKTGVRTYHVSEFSEETTDMHFLELEAAARERQEQIMRTAKKKQKKAPATESEQKTILALIIAGSVLAVIGGFWMIIAGFAESPVWGIAFLLSAGIAEIAFIFVNWDRAKAPFLTQLCGAGLIITAFIIAK